MIAISSERISGVSFFLLAHFFSVSFKLGGREGCGPLCTSIRIPGGGRLESEHQSEVIAASGLVLDGSFRQWLAGWPVLRSLARPKFGPCFKVCHVCSNAFQEKEFVSRISLVRTRKQSFTRIPFNKMTKYEPLQASGRCNWGLMNASS